MSERPASYNDFISEYHAKGGSYGLTPDQVRTLLMRQDVQEHLEYLIFEDYDPDMMSWRDYFYGVICDRVKTYIEAEKKKNSEGGA